MIVLEKPKLTIYFVRSAGVLLLVTAIAKIASACGNARILQMSDPILFISFRYIFWILGVIEIVVSAICFLRNWLKLQVALVALLATNFAIYRIGSLWVGYHKYCPCMGGLTDALHIQSQTADMLMKIILAYLLLGSYTILFWLWQQSKKELPDFIPTQ